MSDKKLFLHEMDWEEAEEAFKKTTVAVLPIGAIHSHETQPLGTDFICADELRKRLGGKTNAIILPTLPYTPCPPYQINFPGSIHIRENVFYETVLDICRCLNRREIKKVVFLNCHGGPTATEAILHQVGNTIREELGMIGVLIEWFHLMRVLKPDIGTEVLEPAAVLSIDPKLIDVKTLFKRKMKGKGETFWGDNIYPNFLWTVEFEGVDLPVAGYRFGEEIEEKGEFFGDKVTAELGEEVLNTTTEYTVKFIKEFEKVEVPP